MAGLDLCFKAGPGSSVAADSEGAKTGGRGGCCNNLGRAAEGLTLGCGSGDGGERQELRNI